MTLLVMALALVTTWRETRRGQPFLDFGHLSSSAECLLDRCDPYDAAALNREAAARRQVKPRVWAEAPVYPPSSMVMVLPLVRVGWPAGSMLFDGVSGALFGVACALMAWRMRIGAGPTGLMLVAGLVCRPILSTLIFANPALMFTALAAIACVLLLDEGVETLDWRAWGLLGAALALKPQLGIGVALTLVWDRRTRRSGLSALAVSLAVLLLGCAAYRWRLGSFEFLARLLANLKLSVAVGNTSDFSRVNIESFDFLNLQTMYSRASRVGRGLAEALAWLTTGTAGLAAWWSVERTGALRRRRWTVIALLSVISLMPVYHRGYDRVVALLLVPAAVEMERISRRLAWGYAAAVCWWVANDTVMGHVLRRWHYAAQNGAEELVICAVLLGSFWWERGREEGAGNLVASEG